MRSIRADSDGVRRRVLSLLIGGAIVSGILDTAQWQLGAEFRGAAGPLGLAIATQFIPWCWLALLLPLVVAAAYRWPLDDGRWRRNLWPHVGATIAFSVVHIAGAVIVAGAFATEEVNYRFLTTKMFLFRLPIDALIYWAAVGLTHGARAAAIAREREKAAAQLEASLTENRLAALRDRLNPHFFFNALNAVSTLALRKDHDGVIRTVEAMSDLLRVTLDERRGQETTLDAELAFLDRYLEIEQLRFGDRLTLGREVEAGLPGAIVPVMLIQPLVENAIRHGAAVKPGPVRIDLRVRRLDRALVLEVADSGPGFGTPVKTNGSGIGLANCRARLAGLYGELASLSVGTSELGGGLVRVTLPLRMSAPAEKA